MAIRVLNANELVEETLQSHLLKIEQKLSGDGLAFVGPITLGIDDALRDAVEAIDNKRDKLIFILETDGGYAETARRIADMLRHHYKMVVFVVPGYALSAGTILVMSGDAIYMDYFSILGPIDPQVASSAGKPIPASGYLIRYEQLLDKANTGSATTAEMELLLNFDQGELYSYEQARDLARALLEEWLVKYKFKDWNHTETRRVAVDDNMKKERARQIADKLQEVRIWNSHAMGISMKQLREQVGLKIDDFGQDVKLNESVRQYHRLLLDYMGKMGQAIGIHTRQGYNPLATQS